ncbi:MAG: SDR family oxidoreductase [Magnetococcus sp. DMHC-6]
MNKTLLITGASRGLGYHLAQRATEDGYRVIGLARHTLPEASFEIRLCDVSDPAAVKQVMSSFKREKTLYGLINAAGIASMNLTLLMPTQTIERLVAVNLLGTIYCSQMVGWLLARQKQGRIINFSTIAVHLALKGEAVYAASKAGVESFSRTFAREMAEHGTTVNVLAPGPIDTDLIAKVSSERIQEVVNQQVISRKAIPEDVYQTVKWLLSEEAAMISGEIIHLGGV